MTDRDAVRRELFITERCGGACLRVAAGGGREEHARGSQSLERSGSD
ncbi:hypothetical protein [Halorubrum sp. SP3]|nr:hypothetical protein [Halorubrum sp. SP3]